ncbi:hypothetical protein [Parasediminibacterium sp. JCM 36343]|uniref:hypothetical protein n=1 Tax=Parasediminibacterium sp. JCM 36343 TaxID=3374279 RepID=UPI00397A35C8
MKNRGRFQAQGNGLEKSSPWATDDTLFKGTALDLLRDLTLQLSPNELDQRILALGKARNFVMKCPFEGVGPLKKSFSNDLQNRAIRIDIEVNSGIAFVTLKNAENGK